MSGKNDTHPDIERVQIQMLRKAGMGKRIELMRSLSKTTIELSRRAIQRRYPELNDWEADLKFVALCYGEELARKLQSDMERRSA